MDTATRRSRTAQSEFYNWSDLFWEQESGEKEIRFFHFKSSVYIYYWQINSVENEILGQRLN